MKNIGLILLIIFSFLNYGMTFQEPIEWRKETNVSRFVPLALYLEGKLLFIRTGLTTEQAIEIANSTPEVTRFFRNTGNGGISVPSNSAEYGLKYIASDEGDTLFFGGENEQWIETNFEGFTKITPTLEYLKRLESGEQASSPIGIKPS